MEARKYNYNGYVQGSTARKFNTVPKREYERPPVRTHERKRKPARQAAASWNIASLTFMTAAVGIMLYVCVSYIQVQHNISTMNKQIAAAESEISRLKNDNDAAYNKVNTAMDLSYVYEVATNELGMVRAEQSQIKTYENIKSDFVKQYGEIPEQKSAFSYLIGKE